MYVQNEYKEGLIYSRKDGTVRFKSRFLVHSQDEVIYSALKEIQKLIVEPNTSIKINYCKDKILDEKPPSQENPDAGIKDLDIVLEKYKYSISNMIYTDEQIFGDNLDGKDRAFRLIWKDKNGEEHFVPLEGIDTFKAENPNGAYTYNSDTKELVFNAVSAENVNYIMRRYK